MDDCNVLPSVIRWRHGDNLIGQRAIYELVVMVNGGEVCYLWSKHLAAGSGLPSPLSLPWCVLEGAVAR
jgi:hypothetical protein